MVYSQKKRSEFFVNFRVNRTQIAPWFKDNAKRITELTTFLRELQADTTVTIESISFCGAASPEGSYNLNKRLAWGRLKALEKAVRDEVEIPDSLVYYNDSYIPWEYLSTLIAASDMPQKDEVLQILRSEPELVEYNRGSGKKIDRRVPRLKALNKGKVWAELYRRYFSEMRNASAVFITFRYATSQAVNVPQSVGQEKITIAPVEILTPAPMPILPTPVAEKWTRRLHFKTNAVGLGLAIANAAVEIDLCKHLSFTLPVYYSAWDYGTTTVKFRTFAFQPELRYWFSDKQNDGWFVGAHFGWAYYNLATNGTYRLQDKDGESPALGGGLAGGYRLPLSANRRWQLEFAVGAGVYGLHYDRFNNYKNGLRVDTKKKTYFGVDQAAITLSYSFKLKKGGAR